MRLLLTLLLIGCQHSSVVCVEDPDFGYYCYDSNHPDCRCSDSSCMCESGFTFDLNTCGCVKEN